MAIDGKHNSINQSTFKSPISGKWICVGSISEYYVEDPVSTATMNKFLSTLEEEQRLFILENGVEWSIEHNFFIVSWNIGVLFSHEHAVEYQLRWK